jgi:aspartyl/asparaginyl-tRNA synthetase
MRLNEDGKQFAPWTFFSWDREIVGGSQREERFDVLVEK